MKFLIISHALHKTKDAAVFSYAPYVREMNIWLKYVDEVEVIAPLESVEVSKIDMAYKHPKMVLTDISAIEFTSVKNVFLSVIKLPKIIFKIFKACRKADHIHLRCPGNIGLLGCLVQIGFPNKIKTAKYAGNWEPKAKQPLSYKVQKRILSNTFLTKNMQVLVYGNWKNQTKNIKSFFTATYTNSEIEKPIIRDYSGKLRFVFAGSLVEGKRPLLAIQVIEALNKQGKEVVLDLFGDGVLREALQNYITINKLENFVILHGNQTKEIIKSALKTAHFSILPSKSEGWPKAIAEAMFFGVIPIGTRISCVPNMLGYGDRGILVEPEFPEALANIAKVLSDFSLLETMSIKASNWSQSYTLDLFEEEISKLLMHS
ncbi:glycosyltransferase family 4 protein [Thalassobellus sediminis]|uniref:glycosyltransferase family 4 protein n=1 Tax=Thalassobellus sediminis TaxID=3367753 RepID=UPI003789FE57